jgi:hypothetical protein
MAVFVPAPMFETISGALAKPKKQNGHKHGNYVTATHRVAATTSKECQRVYLWNKSRYNRSTAVSTHELDIRIRFASVRAMVQARKEDPTKITTDQAAFLAQKDLKTGKKTMNAYLWYVCGQEYDQQNG